jgi:signal transduction histidine kinase
LTHIFDRLYRIDDARSREQGGSGLGLAIVKKLIASLGGTIAVESAPGDGTTFTLRIPAISTRAMPAPVIRSDTPG